MDWSPLLWLLFLSRCEKWKDDKPWWGPLVPEWPLTPQAPPWWPGQGSSNVPTSSSPALSMPEGNPAAPSFPSDAWEPDRPPPQAVQDRAVSLLPALWSRGENSYHQEHTGARWITYQAKSIGTKRGVVAYRLKSERPGTVAPSVPPPAAPIPPNAAAPPRRQTPQRPPRPRPSVARRPTVTPTSTAPATTLPTLRFGAGLKPAPPNESVRVAQQKLGIIADGRFGNGTLAAVKAFQSSKGLTPDGVIGAKTWTALYGSQRAA